MSDYYCSTAGESPFCTDMSDVSICKEHQSKHLLITNQPPRQRRARERPSMVSARSRSTTAVLLRIDLL